jgi:hypothetical protein
MKMTCFIFLPLIVCNISFSQDIFDQNSSENDSLNSRNLKDKPAVFKSYPNPVETYLYVIGNLRLQSVEFINVSGKTQLFYKVNKAINRLDTSELKKGMYLIKVTNENYAIEVKRIVKL